MIFLTPRVSVDLSSWGGSILTPVLVLHVSACGASTLSPVGDPPVFFVQIGHWLQINEDTVEPSLAAQDINPIAYAPDTAPARKQRDVEPSPQGHRERQAQA